jgi:hypothetical protein
MDAVTLPQMLEIGKYFGLPGAGRRAKLREDLSRARTDLISDTLSLAQTLLAEAKSAPDPNKLEVVIQSVPFPQMVLEPV